TPYSTGRGGAFPFFHRGGGPRARGCGGRPRALARMPARGGADSSARPAAASPSRGCRREAAPGAARPPAAPATASRAAAFEDVADTLSRVPTLPKLYDGDTTNLLPRWAEKLESGSKEHVHCAIQRRGLARDAA